MYRFACILYMIVGVVALLGCVVSLVNTIFGKPRNIFVFLGFLTLVLFLGLISPLFRFVSS
jgi:hypothetical protein